MRITEAVFIGSSSKFNQLPDVDKPEYAFIGRSNVGKSSLINALCGRRALAKTSSNPGKTITINHFLINQSWYLVDLPGYGYAKRSKEMRKAWEKTLYEYLQNRTNLMTSFVLVDIRIPAQANDLEFIDWLGTQQLPFVVLFTKADKVSEKQIVDRIDDFKDILTAKWAEPPPMMVTSALKKQGLDEILSYIKRWNDFFYDHSNSIMS